MSFGSIFKAALAGLVLAYFFALADHLYMVNGTSYPVGLSKPVTIKSMGDRGIEGLTELCGGVGGWQFYPKDNGVFMRCKTMVTGSYWRPTTYLIENYDQLASESYAE
jgi:hypothetical protein